MQVQGARGGVGVGWIDVLREPVAAAPPLSSPKPTSQAASVVNVIYLPWEAGFMMISFVYAQLLARLDRLSLNLCIGPRLQKANFQRFHINVMFQILERRALGSL